MITPILIPLEGGGDPMPWWGWLIIAPICVVGIAVIVFAIWEMFR